MSELIAALEETIKSAVKSELSAMIKPGEIFPDLKPISTVPELAAVLRVSDDVLRRMAEDGMPHAHAGRELRFSKALLTEWQITGRKYFCETCDAKGTQRKPENDPPANNIYPLSENSTQKLAAMALKQ